MSHAERPTAPDPTPLAPSGGRARPGVLTGGEVSAIPTEAAEIRAALQASGRPEGVATAPLLTHPYPTALALAGVPRSPATWLSLTSRMLVVQWRDPDGTRRTLLWEPRDHERSPHLPDAYLAARRMPMRRVVHGTVPGHLRALGLAPAEVDYVAFSTLRGLDPRRLLGTTVPASDLGSPHRALEGWLPRARLLVARAEWEALEHLHPLQRPWYQPGAFAELAAERVVELESDAQVGPGVALLATPGRTCGHLSLALHTDGGVWVCSGNGVAAESWAPRASRIAGLRAWAVAWGREVLPCADDPVSVAAQYDAMLLERQVADTSRLAPFPQCLPTSELTAHRLAPGLSPTHAHRAVTHGVVRGSSPV